MKAYWKERQFMKLISVIFAIALWFYVLHTSDVVEERQITLKIDPPVGKAISNNLERKLTVKVRGARMFVRSISSEVIQLDMDDFQRVANGEYRLLIKPGHIFLPFGVELIDYSPKKILVKLEKKISKYVPIKAQLVGQLPDELRLVNFQVKPSKVLIEGPISEMRKVTRVLTAPVLLDGLRGEGQQEITLESFDSRVRVMSEKKFSIHYSVRSKKANMTIKGVKIRYLSSRRKFSSAYWTVSLSVLAPEGVKKQVDKSKIQVIAELPEGVKGEFSIKLKAILPEGMHLLKIHPEKIPVVIK